MSEQTKPNDAASSNPQTGKEPTSGKNPGNSGSNLPPPKPMKVQKSEDSSRIYKRENK